MFCFLFPSHGFGFRGISCQKRLINFFQQGFPGTPVPHELRTKNLTVWTDSACSEFLEDYIYKTSIICAGIFLRGPCFGDQGGPITENDQIIGISVNRSCWQENPALFVKVGPYRSFINSATNGETSWA